jgi:LysR family hca operon transcriptional activator
MELRHLRYFIEVAEQGAFGRAAQSLRVAQPSLSRQIHALESEIGTPLFERLPRGVRLTPAGEVFLVEARAIVGSASRAVDRARLAAAHESSVLRLAHGELYVYAAEIAQLLAACHRLHPQTHVEVISLSDAETELALHEGRVDVGCVFMSPNEVGGLGVLPMVETSGTGVLLPANHPLAAQPAVKPGDLSAVPWLGTTADRWSTHAGEIETALRARGINSTRVKSRPLASPFVSVAATEVWALVSERVGKSYSDSSSAVVYRPLAAPPIPAWLSLVWVPPASELVQGLVDAALSIGLDARASAGLTSPTGAPLRHPSGSL